MYLNHQLFGNFPFIDVKYLWMSTQQKAFVSASPLQHEDLPVFVVCWARGSVQGLQYCDCGQWGAPCSAPLADEEVIPLPVTEWMGSESSSRPAILSNTRRLSATRAGHCRYTAHRPTRDGSSVIAADGTCISPHCACPLLVPCTCVSNVVGGWWE